MPTIRIDETLSVGPQPTEYELHELKSQGFRSVVSLRTFAETEAGGDMHPDEEAEKVHRLGMEFRHIPISEEAMVPKVIDDFSDTIQRVPHPVFVHCGGGRRSAAFALAHSAMRRRQSSDMVMTRAHEAGFELEGTPIGRALTSYIDHHVGEP